MQTKLSWLKLFPLKMERGRSEGSGDDDGEEGGLFEEVQDLTACVEKAAPTAFAQSDPSLVNSFCCLKFISPNCGDTQHAGGSLLNQKQPSSAAHIYVC